MKQKSNTKKTADKSQNPLNLIAVGVRATGKSSTIAKILEGKKCVVFSNNYPVKSINKITRSAGDHFSPDLVKAVLSANEVFQIIPSLNVERNEQVLMYICSMLKDVAIVIDDLRDWTQSRTRVKSGIYMILSQGRPRKLDVFIAVHHFAQIPTDLLDHDPEFIIKRTTRPPNKSFLDVLPDPDAFLSIVERINQEAKTREYSWTYCRPFAEGIAENK